MQRDPVVYSCEVASACGRRPDASQSFCLEGMSNAKCYRNEKRTREVDSKLTACLIDDIYHDTMTVLC